MAARGVRKAPLGNIAIQRGPEQAKYKSGPTSLVIEKHAPAQNAPSCTKNMSGIFFNTAFYDYVLPKAMSHP